MQRLLTLILITLLSSLSYSLLLGDSGWLQYRNHQKQIAIVKMQSEMLQEDNSRLKAEVSHLKKGLDAIEASARHDLGMIKPNETFFYVIDENDTFE